MKIKKSHIKKVIKEEIKDLINEIDTSVPQGNLPMALAALVNAGGAKDIESMRKDVNKAMGYLKSELGLSSAPGWGKIEENACPEATAALKKMQNIEIACRENTEYIKANQEWITALNKCAPESADAIELARQSSTNIIDPEREDILRQAGISPPKEPATIAGRYKLPANEDKKK
jgi:hypothetical protein